MSQLPVRPHSGTSQEDKPRGGEEDENKTKARRVETTRDDNISSSGSGADLGQRKARRNVVVVVVVATRTKFEQVRVTGAKRDRGEEQEQKKRRNIERHAYERTTPHGGRTEALGKSAGIAQRLELFVDAYSLLCLLWTSERTSAQLPLSSEKPQRQILGRRSRWRFRTSRHTKKLKKQEEKGKSEEWV